MTTSLSTLVWSTILTGVLFGFASGVLFQRFVNWTVVQEQQAAVDRPCAAMIATADLPLMDAVHFTTGSYRVIGGRFAEAYLRVAGMVECR